MGTDLLAIFSILSTPPGHLIYHLVVSSALLLTSGLAIAKLNQSPRGQQARHILVGCLFLLLLQIALFIIGFLSIEDITHTILEQTAGILTILWLVWTFVEKDKHFILTGASIFLSLSLVLICGVILTINTLMPSLLPINMNLISVVWQSISLLLILIGFIIILVQRPSKWGVGTAILCLLSIGHFIQILLIDIEPFQLGAVRLAQTLSFPWLLALVQRFSKQQSDDPSPTKNISPYPDKSPVDTKPLLVEQLLKIALQNTKSEKYQAVVKALSLAAVSDVCFLAESSGNEAKVHFIAGYDLIREEQLPTLTVDQRDLPHIWQAWEDKKSLNRSHLQLGSPDMHTLTRLLNYPHIGNLFAYPLTSSDGARHGGILFLTPYTNKAWGEKIITLLNEIDETLSEVLFSQTTQEELKELLDEEKAKANVLIEEKEIFKQRIVINETTIEVQEKKIKQLKAKYQIEKIETVKQINQLTAQINALKNKVSAQIISTSELEQMRDDYRQLTEERDQLKLSLSRTAAKLQDLENKTGQTGPMRLSMDNQIISLDSIAANVRLQVASQLSEKDHFLEVINPDGRQMIKTDPELLQSVITKLLENALLASKENETVQLNLNVLFETGMLIVEVKDFGEGLTPEEQTAFFSADQKTIPGIGSIQAIRDAIRAIRVLNGKIWLKSKKGTFTSFRVQLPIRIID